MSVHVAGSQRVIQLETSSSQSLTPSFARAINWEKGTVKSIDLGNFASMPVSLI